VLSTAGDRLRERQDDVGKVAGAPVVRAEHVRVDSDEIVIFNGAFKSDNVAALQSLSKTATFRELKACDWKRKATERSSDM